MEFQVGDKVMLKVSPWKGVIHFDKWGKLNPRYVGPFKVLENVGEVAYKLELLKVLSRVHNTFHVSNLKKCHADEPLAIPLDVLHLDDKLRFVKEPEEIVGREVKRLKQSRIPLVKVRWNSKRGPEFIWEREDQFKKKYPQLFTKTASSSSVASGVTCAEKIIRILFGDEIVIVRGDGSSNEHGTRLNIISCTKAQEYLTKGCHVFLANITATKDEDKSKGKRLEDVPVVQEFPEVFPEDLSGIPPTRQVEF
ncbi:hypothetical protein Tco_0662563 [Tanacetum coccineum]